MSEGDLTPEPRSRRLLVHVACTCNFRGHSSRCIGVARATDALELQSQRVFEAIGEATSAHFAASDDITGKGGDWVMESDGQDIQPLYFSEDVESFDGSFVPGRRTRRRRR